MHRQVLVVGAGPTGLALAAVCLRLGLSVRLVEKKSGPSITSKAIGLQYRVSEILACMGVADRFLRRSGSPTTVNMYAQSRRLVSLQFKADGHESGRGAFQPRPLMIAQSETEKILGDVVRERGGEVEWNTELTGLTQNAERVAQLRAPDGTEQFAACDWLVSCEGAHSVARNAIGAEFAGKTYPLAFVMADVELHGAIAPGENHVWIHPDGSFAALPFPQKDRWRLFVEVTRQQPRRFSANVDLAMIQELMKERIGDIALHIDNPTWISPFGINCRLVDRYRRGRVLLAGDAAHIHSPTGGQGIATGIQDAINLGWKLARVIAGAPADLLDTYEQERRAHAEEVLHETNRTTSIFFAPTPLTRILRDGIVLPLLRSAWVQRRMFAKLSQLHVHYRRSRLSRDDRPFWSLHTGLRPGERAPDFLLRHHAGTLRSSLFELLSSGRPLALVGPGEAACVRIDALLALLGSFSVEAWIVVDPQAAPWQGHSRALTDTHRELERLYGLRGEFLCLIRPDDHIGLIQAPIDETALRAYLRYISPPPRIQLQAQPSAQATLHNA